MVTKRPQLHSSHSRSAIANDGIVTLDHEIAKSTPDSAAETTKPTSKFLVHEAMRER